MQGILIITTMKLVPPIQCIHLASIDFLNQLEQYCIDGGNERRPGIVYTYQYIVSIYSFRDVHTTCTINFDGGKLYTW